MTLFSSFTSSIHYIDLHLQIHAYTFITYIRLRNYYLNEYTKTQQVVPRRSKRKRREGRATAVGHHGIT
jgi:hypothetical protein